MVIIGLTSIGLTALLAALALRLSPKRAGAASASIGLLLGGTLAASFAVAQALWPALLIAAAPLLAAALGARHERQPLPDALRLGLLALLLGLTIAFAVPLFLLRAELGVALPAPLLLVLLLLAGLGWIEAFVRRDDGAELAVGELAFIALAGGGVLLTSVPRAADLTVTWWLLSLGAVAVVLLFAGRPLGRVRLGQAGSLFAGFTLALLALLSIAFGWLGVWVWPILAAAVITDAAVSLWRPQRPPARHLGALFGLHLLWLLPLAVLAQQRPELGGLAALAAYLPAVALAVWRAQR